MQSCNLDSSRDSQSQSDDGSEHFFVPLSSTRISPLRTEKKAVTRMRDLDSLNEFDRINGYFSAVSSNFGCYDIGEAQEQVFSPPLLMDTSLLADAYEDLLGMLIFTFITLYILMLSSLFRVYLGSSDVRYPSFNQENTLHQQAVFSNTYMRPKRTL